jgi:hypothetical protein
VLYGESATDYAADVESNPFHALYARPGVIALLPRWPDGVCSMSVAEAVPCRSGWWARAPT